MKDILNVVSVSVSDAYCSGLRVVSLVYIEFFHQIVGYIYKIYSLD